MKIGILEVLWHEAFLKNLIISLRNKEEKLCIFTTQTIYKRLLQLLDNDVSHLDFVLKGYYEPLPVYLQRIRRYCNKNIDFLFVNTLLIRDYKHCIDIPNFFLFHPKVKKVLITGRVDNWFNHYANKTGFRKKIEFFGYSLIRKKYDAYIVHTQKHEEYAKSFEKAKPVFTVPYVILDEQNIPPAKKFSPEKKPCFIVPGSVHEIRRDYDILYRILEKIPLPHLQKFTLIFNGRPVGKRGTEIIQKFMKFKEKGLDFIAYDSYVDENEYMNNMRKSDLIISPTRPDHYMLQGYTAAVVEALNHGLPIIFPASYEPIDEIKKICYYYQNEEELFAMLMQYLDNPQEIRQLHTEADALIRNFSSKVWREKIRNYIDLIMDL
jgi:glutaredoxin